MSVTISRPPIKRAEGIESPLISIFTKQSLCSLIFEISMGSDGDRMAMNQVPVDTMVASLSAISRDFLAARRAAFES